MEGLTLIRFIADSFKMPVGWHADLSLTISPLKGSGVFRRFPIVSGLSIKPERMAIYPLNQLLDFEAKTGSRSPVWPFLTGKRVLVIVAAKN
jgi:hypothetical protein